MKRKSGILSELTRTKIFLLSITAFLVSQYFIVIFLYCLKIKVRKSQICFISYPHAFIVYLNNIICHCHVSIKHCCSSKNILKTFFFHGNVKNIEHVHRDKLEDEVAQFYCVSSVCISRKQESRIRTRNQT